MTWGQILRVGVELAIDLVREALAERKSATPARAPGELSYLDVERQAQASRNAGHETEPPVTKPARRPTPPGR